MKKYYTEPQLEIRKYAVSPNGIGTDSVNTSTLGPTNPDLNTDDSKGDYFE